MGSALSVRIQPVSVVFAFHYTASLNMRQAPAGVGGGCRPMEPGPVPQDQPGRPGEGGHVCEPVGILSIPLPGGLLTVHDRRMSFCEYLPILISLNK